MIPRRGSDKESRRKDILVKAQTLFAQKGYLSTSMAEIASAGELAVGSLYSLFSSKEEILATIFQDHIDRVLSEVERIRDNAKLSPREKIDRTLDVLVRNYVDNQDFYRIYVAEARGVEWGVRTEVGEYIYEGSSRYVRVLADMFREAIKAGEADSKLDPEFLALLLRSFVHSTVSHCLYGNRRVTVDELLAVAKRLLFEGIGAGPAD